MSIVTDISGRIAGEIQKYRTYVYQNQSIAVSTTAAGNVTESFTLLNTQRQPMYAGIYSIDMPANTYLQSVSLSGNVLVITLYSTTAVSGTMTFSVISVQ